VTTYPCPFCAHCDRLLSLAEAILAEANDGLCMDCLVEAVESGKLAFAVEYDAEPVEVCE
jgi:hypothetical protein